MSKWKTFIKTFQFAYKANRFYTIGLITSSILKSLLILGGLLSQKWLLEGLLQTNSQQVIYALLFYTFVWISRNLLAHFKEYLALIHIPIINNYVNDAILKKLDRLETKDIESSEFNDIYVNIQTFGKAKFANTIDASGELIQSFSSFIISLIAIASQNYIIAIIIASFALMEAAFQTRTAKGMKSLQDEVTLQRKEADYYLHLNQDQKHYFPLKTYNLLNYFTNKINLLQNEIIAKSKRFVIRLKIRAASIGTLSNILGNILPVGYFALETAKGAMSIGSFVFIRGVIEEYFRSTFVFYAYINQIYENTLYLEDMFVFLEKEEAKLGTKTIKAKQLGFEFKNVSFQYPNSKHTTLESINIKVESGEKVAIVGANGAGKSTLVKLLAGYYFPTQGSVVVNNIDTTKLNLNKYRDSIAFMTQDVLNLYLTVKENIQIGDLRKKKPVREALKKAELFNDVERLQQKEDTKLGTLFKGGVNLSGGQWQKIALSRAFYRNASLVILDEPTSAIDSEHEIEIFNNIFDKSNTKTFVIISHKFSNINKADRIIVLDKGRIREEGNHKVLMAKKGTYYKLYNKQKEAFIKK